MAAVSSRIKTLKVFAFLLDDLRVARNARFSISLLFTVLYTLCGLLIVPEQHIIISYKIILFSLLLVNNSFIRRPHPWHHGIQQFTL